jgi:hypothetical protein
VVEPGQPLVGTVLVLRDSPTRPRSRRLLAVARDSRIDLTGTRGTADDPSVAGGAVHILATAGDVFDLEQLLPASGWRTVGKAEAPRGYRFRSDGPIRSVSVKSGGFIRVVGSGSDLALSLQGDPDPVVVEVTIGGRRYCMRFGGDTTFNPGKRFTAHAAPAPAQCD